MSKRIIWSLVLAAILAPAVVLAGGGGGPGGGGGFGGGGGGGGGFGGGGPGGGGGGGFGGAGGFGAAQITDFVGMQVGFTDQEWTVVQPKLQKVVEAQTSVNSGRGRGGFGGGRGFGGGPGGGGPGGAGGGGGPPPSTDPVAKAYADLNTLLMDANATPDQIKAKLQAYRDARATAQKSLTAARDDLKKVCSIREEAALVTLGYLE